MPTIMDFYNTGLTAASNQTRNQFLEPMLAAQLYQTQTQNKYLDPMLAAQLQNKQLVNKYYGREKESEIGYRNAQTALDDLKRKYPLLGQPGALGQIAGALYLRDTGANFNGLNAPFNTGTVPSPAPVNAPVSPVGGLATPIVNGAPMPQANTMPTPISDAVNAPPSTGGLFGNMTAINPAPSAAPQSIAAPSAPMSPADLVLQGLNTSMNEKQSFANYRQKQTQAYNYMSLPVDQKSALLAQAAGMGYDPTMATQLFMEGNSIEDLAKAKGFDMGSLPTPIYPTTKTALTQIQKRDQALAEINNLNPVLNAAIAPYSRRIFGYSPKQISEALQGTDKDSQARFLAARALIPEMSALRLRAMSGQVGIEALREVTDASMSHVKVFQSLVDPDVFQKASTYIDQWINDAVSAANKRGLQTFGSQNTGNAQGASENDPLGLLGGGSQNDPLGLLK